MKYKQSNNSLLLDEAAGWIARLRSDQVTAADQQNFAVWLSAGSAQREAFDQMESLWQDLGVVKFNIADNTATAQAKFTQAMPETRHRWLTSGRRSLAAAAAVLVAILLAWQLSPDSQHQPDKFSTAVGEQQLITLADESTVQMNTDTTISVDYSASERRVTLQQGEAFFTVVEDNKRPFVVEVAEATVTAVGTAFNIRQQGERTLITVTEGTVKVADKNSRLDAAPASEIVRAKQQVVVREDTGLGPVADTDVEQVTAWQRKQLVFEDSPLSDVVAEINRYSTQEIRIVDPSLASVPVSGVFILDDPLATLQGLEASLGLEQVEQDGLILLYKKSL